MEHKKILIVNGPNLNLLGRREPEIYGYSSFEDFFIGLKSSFPDCVLDYFQSNNEGALISCVQNAGVFDGLVINAGAYAHTSIALADALASIPQVPAVEVHISNVFSRESFRHQSFLTRHCKGLITGLGLEGYALALRALLDRALD